MCLTKIQGYGIFKYCRLYIFKICALYMQFLDVKIGALLCFLNGFGIAGGVLNY